MAQDSHWERDCRLTHWFQCLVIAPTNWRRIPHVLGLENKPQVVSYIGFVALVFAVLNTSGLVVEDEYKK